MELSLNLMLVGAGLVVLALSVLVALVLRRVVPTNEVHIVQSAKNTKSYGKDTGNGNTYYEWPTSIPFFGITKSVFQTSIFDLDLSGYEAYDKGRLPFVVDVKAFFQIKDSNAAAAKVATFSELKEQLLGVVQGAVRTILASSEIEEIMQGRSKFGEEFTKEVNEQLSAWGVETVKNLELMDIRDNKGSVVISNIMAKKQSLIEMESRTEVARNKKSAEMAEIEARREVDLQKQQAIEAVGLRTTATERQVALAKQEAIQVVKEQEKTTKEREMNILKVEQVRKAEIAKEVQLVTAAQARETSVIEAEGQKQTSLLIAEGQLEAKRREAEGITLEGKAKADAERAMLSAPVEAQITLAKEIGGNESYQKYLLSVEQIKAHQAVGIAQAEALENADIKVIANSGNVSSGLSGISDLISSKGGIEVGAMLQGLASTEVGQKLINKFVPDTNVVPASSNGKTPVMNGKGHA